MSGGTLPEHRHRDLDDREEIAEFVTRFYRDIAQDARFHHWFETIAHVDWRDEELFERWLSIFDVTLDAGWSGPLAETARHRAHGIAWAMAKRLAGIDLRR